MESRENVGEGKDGLAGEVMESLGESQEAAHEVHADEEPNERSNETLAVQKRLKAQKRQHERELRELHARMADMQSRLSAQAAQQPVNASMPPQGSTDDAIHKAVSVALAHRDEMERKAKDAENQAQIQKQYAGLYKHLDSMDDKYDDFRDVVFSDDAKFTPSMRDYAMTLPRNGAGSAGEVFYKLAKNPQELERISRLHPIDQAAEMVKLSHALINGGEQKSAQSQAVKPMGNIKSNPAYNSGAITERTPVSSIRERMKAGKFR